MGMAGEKELFLLGGVLGVVGEGYFWDCEEGVF